MDFLFPLVLIAVCAIPITCGCLCIIYTCFLMTTPNPGSAPLVTMIVGGIICGLGISGAGNQIDATILRFLCGLKLLFKQFLGP